MSEPSSCVSIPRFVQQERICLTTHSESDSSDSDEGPSVPANGLVTTNSRLQEHFAEEMQSVAQPRSHVNVAVLLIQWEVEGEDFLDTRKEVEDLRAVFKDTYNFSVRQATLHTSKTSLPKKHLISHLSALIKDEDVPNALLIVYYAGHAVTKNDELWLSGGNRKRGRSKHESQISWQEVEPHLTMADADLLVIFDCCFAGALTYDARAPNSDRIFEYIGATVRDRTARGPGEKSFTNALIWALKRLSNRADGFTAVELVSEIRLHPSFRKAKQEPVCSTRGKVESRYKLKIVPLTAQWSIPENQRSDTQRREALETVFLDLQLSFDRCPRKKDISELTNSLKDLVERGSLPLTQVRWRGLSDVDIKPDIRDVAWKFAKQIKWRKLHKHSPSGEVVIGMPTEDAQVLENDDRLVRKRQINLVGWLSLGSWHHYAARALRCTTWGLIQQCFWSQSKRSSGAPQSRLS
ncbi:hypothetical protein PV11_07478 [Exophiala sideris]|uniref:Peptidase C14 caspase domain-containing protein n=1 Tax=Exophiala sideris TaxID=1016849 RepID=A0A0D1YG91_9EURO|nr:hypothetical protein PV11_07478 [Exophiala sideris]